MGKVTFREIDIAIQNADLTNHQINRLIRTLEGKQNGIALEPIEYEPPSSEITTIEQAQDYIENLEKTVDSYQANIDAILRIYRRGERLTVVKKPNGKVEPYYSSTQWAHLCESIQSQARQASVSYVLDYINPYAESVSNLIAAMTTISNSVFQLKTSDLKHTVIGGAGALMEALGNLIERREIAMLTNDLSVIQKDVTQVANLLVNFTKNPTSENHEELKQALNNWKTKPIQQLLEYRDSLPSIGRKNGATDKRVIIWRYAEPYYNKYGADYAGEKALDGLEQEIAELKKQYSEDEIKQIYPAEWSALQTLKYTVRNGVQWERKRINSSEGASLAGYTRQLASDAQNGKLQVASDK